MIDLHGRLAIPGFVEGHGHFTALGESKMMLDLRGAKNWDEIVAMVAQAARKAKPGAWILGSGFRQAKWDRAPEPNVLGFPVHDSLSRVSARNPVWLTHASGHAGFANAEALRLAGIDQNTKDPPGGEILRDRQGRPTGLLNESAQELVDRVLDAYRAHRSPAEAEAELREQIRLAEQECLAKGITTFEDAGSPFATVDLFRKMAERGELRLRLWVMLRAPQAELEAKARQYYMLGVGGDHLTVRDQGIHGRRARVARGVAAPAVFRFTRRCHESNGVERGDGSLYSKDGGIRDREWLSALHARNRGPGESRGAESVPGGFSRAWWREELALADRACATSGPGRYPALRRAGRDRGDAGDSLHL